MILQIKNKRLEALNNRDDHKSIYKNLFDNVVKERFDEVKELTNEIDYKIWYIVLGIMVIEILMILIVV